MNEGEAIDVAQEAILTLLLMAGPVMAVALTIGLIIALFQALTQLQEMTLVFVPKIVIVFVSLLLFLPFMLAQISAFFEGLADKIIGLP
ncbi:MAG: flagellar biosynthesis protein FliQ [Alphaproteobacteria bacterium]|nr:flagellar biosynthesis protein FliQ [Alphaproteobacteria bacterium]